MNFQSSRIENNEKMLRKNYAVLISSFDGYSSAWHPFFTLFFKYWPDCAAPIYLIANHLQYNDTRVKTLNTPNDQGWSSNLIHALNQIEEDCILYLQEDYFLTAKVETSRINQMVRVISDSNAAYLRLSPKKEAINFMGFTEVQEIPKTAQYLNATQACIWDRKKLLSLLQAGETGWDFELRGGIERARAMKSPFLCSKEEIIHYYKTAIVKGEYLYDALNLCRNEGIKIIIPRLKEQSELKSKVINLAIYKKLEKSIHLIKNIIRRSYGR